MISAQPSITLTTFLFLCITNHIHHNTVNPILDKMIGNNCQCLEPEVTAQGPSFTPPKVSFDFGSVSSGSGKPETLPLQPKIREGEGRLEEKKTAPFKTRKIGFCPSCRKFFADIQAHLPQHPILHYKCTQCSPTTPLGSLLDLCNHMRRAHPGELWSCIGCEEWFANWHEAKYHFIRAHPEQVIS